MLVQWAATAENQREAKRELIFERTPKKSGWSFGTIIFCPLPNGMQIVD